MVESRSYTATCRAGHVRFFHQPSPPAMKYDRPELAQRHPCLCNAPPPPLSPTSVPPRYSISAMDCPTHCTVPCCPLLCCLASAFTSHQCLIPCMITKS